VIEPISVSVAQASTLTGFSRSRIYELISTGELKAVKQGARTVILYDALRQFVVALPPIRTKAKTAAQAGARA
jgi:excisionase family DNA binding protein